MVSNLKDIVKMTSKERVLAAFANTQPDKVPVNFFANKGIYNKLINHYGLKLNDGEQLLQILGVDFRGVVPSYKGLRLHKEVSGVLVDPEWGIRKRWVENESGGYWDYCDFPLKDANEEQVAAWPVPSPDDYDYSVIEQISIRYKDFAVFTGGPGMGDIINKSGMIRGMEQTLVDLITDNPAGLLWIDRRLKVQLEVLERTLDAARGKIDFLWFGEDLGTQKGPMISMELYRKHIRPRQQQYIDLAKAYKIPVMIHSCGSSSWAFDDFIEMGINVVDTLQPEANEMSPEYLKKRFGGRLAFHGCISTAGPLAYGTIEEIETHVTETCEIMMPGGGYCLAPTHLIQDNSPVENVVAVYEAAHKYGRYI